MEEEKNNKIVRSKLVIKTLIATTMALILCIVSLGVGHGSGVLFKLAFPLPYALFELVDLITIANSVFALFIPGLIQFGFYFEIIERFKSRMSRFLSYMIVVLLHMLVATIVAINFE